MIGTIIIAVTGYGVAIFLLVTAGCAAGVVWREPSDSLKGRRAARVVAPCLIVGVLLTVITRWLAGV